MPSYSRVFKQAFTLLKVNKTLWMLSLFFIWAVLGNTGNYFASNAPSADKINFWISVALFIVLIVGTVLYLQAKCGLIYATKQLLDKKPIKFKEIFAEGSKYYVKVFSISFYLSLIVLIPTLIILFIIIHFFDLGLDTQGYFLTTLGLAVLIPSYVVYMIMYNLAPMFIVFYQFDIKKAAEASFELVKALWIYLLGFLIYTGLLGGFMYYLLYLVWSQRVEFFGNLSYNLLGIGLYTVLLLFAAFVSSYMEVCWVVLFNELVKPPKIEEEETAPVPDIV